MTNKLHSILQMKKILSFTTSPKDGRAIRVKNPGNHVNNLVRLIRPDSRRHGGAFLRVQRLVDNRPISDIDFASIGFDR